MARTKGKLEEILQGYLTKKEFTTDYIDEQVELALEESDQADVLDKNDLTAELKAIYDTPVASYQIGNKVFKPHWKQKELTVGRLLKVGEVTDAADKIYAIGEFVFTMVTRGRFKITPYLKAVESVAKLPIIYAISQEFGSEYGFKLLMLEATSQIPVVGNIIDIQDNYVTYLEAAIRKRAVENVAQHQKP